MPEEAGREDGPDAADRPSGRGPTLPILTQAEIDAVTGFAPSPPTVGGADGLRALVGAGALPRDRMPMLDVALGRLARQLQARLRDTFGGEITVVPPITSFVRIGAYLDAIVLPTQLVVVRPDRWAGPGLVVAEPSLVFALLDSMLGAGRQVRAGGAPVRPFSPIERQIVVRLTEALLREAEPAFAAVAPTSFAIECTEADPRLVEIGPPAEGAILARFALSIDGQEGSLDLLLPQATLEPVRDRLAQGVAGEKLGQDPFWAGHLAGEVWRATVETEAVLHEMQMPLGRVLALGIGDTLTFSCKPADLIELRCGGVGLTRGRVGRVDGHIAVQVTEMLRDARPTSAGLDSGTGMDGR